MIYAPEMTGVITAGWASFCYADGAWGFPAGRKERRVKRTQFPPLLVISGVFLVSVEVLDHCHLRALQAFRVLWSFWKGILKFGVYMTFFKKKWFMLNRYDHAKHLVWVWHVSGLRLLYNYLPAFNVIYVLVGLFQHCLMSEENKIKPLREFPEETSSRPSEIYGETALSAFRQK